MSDLIVKWFQNRLQLWILVATAITSTAGIVYAGNQYLDQFATDNDVNAVQLQFGEIYYNGKISDYQEQQFEIQDKIVDEIATKSDQKKLIRLKIKINSLKEELKSYRESIHKQQEQQ